MKSGNQSAVSGNGTQSRWYEKDLRYSRAERPGALGADVDPPLLD